VIAALAPQPAEFQISTGHPQDFGAPGIDSWSIGERAAGNRSHAKKDKQISVAIPDIVASYEDMSICRGERSPAAPESAIRARFVPDSFSFLRVRPSAVAL
jgi:hypothetical protein